MIKSVIKFVIIKPTHSINGLCIENHRSIVARKMSSIALDKIVAAAKSLKNIRLLVAYHFTNNMSHYR